MNFCVIMHNFSCYEVIMHCESGELEPMKFRPPARNSVKESLKSDPIETPSPAEAPSMLSPSKLKKIVYEIAFSFF
jgi:hypothetical protein